MSAPEIESPKYHPLQVIWICFLFLGGNLVGLGLKGNQQENRKFFHFDTYPNLAAK